MYGVRYGPDGLLLREDLETGEIDVEKVVAWKVSVRIESASCNGTYCCHQDYGTYASRKDAANVIGLAMKLPGATEARITEIKEWVPKT